MARNCPNWTPHREGPRRICETRGCKTILTTANPDNRCVVHGGFRPQTTTDSARAVKDDRADLWYELLEGEPA